MPNLTLRYSLLYTIWFLLLSICILVVLASVPGYLSGWPFGFSRAIEGPAWALAVYKLISVLSSLGGALLSIGLAVLLFARKRREGLALFISFYLLVYAVVMSGPLEAVPHYWGVLGGLAIPLQTALLTAPTIYLFATFPDGRFVPGWTRWLVAGSVVITVIIFIRPIETFLTFSDLTAQLVAGALGAAMLAGLYAQLFRYRRVSGYIQRQQTKWVVAGLILWIGYLSLSTYPWFVQQNIPTGDPLPWWIPLASAGWWASLSILPLSLAIAILRARLWDIDLLIRRTLVYAVLTGVLGLVYFGGVVLLQNIFDALAGRHESPLITVLSTLAIAALFNPLRTRIQDFIDRRFYRQKYDAEQTLAHFAATARDEVDMDSLSIAMLGAVDETLQPAKISLWLAGKDL